MLKVTQVRPSLQINRACKF